MAAVSGNNAQNAAIARQGSTHLDRLRIWREDLESIRRETPVVSPGVYIAKQLVMQEWQPAGSSQGTQEPVIVSDSEDDAGQVQSPSALLRSFYGLASSCNANEANIANDKIKYQDQSLARARKYPSRQNGMGFDMARLRRDMGWTSAVRTLQDVQPSWDHGMFMQHPPLGFDEAVSRNWSRDSSSACLLSGFPMLGDVVMYRAMNYGGARSSCFFKALAYLVYGDQSLYQRVQSEHLQHFSDVLEWVDHPRHEMYTMLNRQFWNTTISTEASLANNPPIRDVEAMANTYQILSIPQAWMPLDLLDITADLYNLFIVVYTITESPSQDQPLVTEVNVKGSYNARHVFLLFNGFHYQPMVPNEFLASEFTFPRVTYENVRGFQWTRDTDQGKSSINLRWRSTWGNSLDRRIGALPVDHVFYRETLRTVMTGVYS